MKRTTATWGLLALAILGSTLVMPTSSDEESAARPAAAVERIEPTSPYERMSEAAFGERGTVAPEVVLFAPELPDPPARLPRLPERFTLAAPKGRVHVEVIEALRRRDCASALDALQYGLHEVSIDYAGLVRSVWMCFDSVHGQALRTARIEWPFRLWEVFEHLGRREATGAEPAWYQHAVTGLELRLERYTADALLREITEDLYGQPGLADRFAVDLQLEALAATTLSRLPSEQWTPSRVDQWARRVFVVEWALGQQPGALLSAYRPEVVTELRRLLDEAMAPADGPVPPSVLEARAVARGERPPPRRPGSTVKPARGG